MKNPEKMNFPVVMDNGDIVEAGHLLDPEKPGHYRDSVLKTLAQEPEKMDPNIAEKIIKHLETCPRNHQTGRPSCKEIYEEFLLKQQIFLEK